MKIQVPDSEHADNLSVLSLLSAQQQRMWVLDQLEHSGAPHNVALCLRLKGCLNLSALEESVKTLPTRHPILRSRFNGNDGIPHTTFATAECCLTVSDLTHLPDSEREQTVLRLAAEQLHEPLDLEAGPAFRAKLFLLSPVEHVLVLVTHQIICDAKSLNLLAQELAALYGAISKGEPLPGIAVQYADYIQWQQGYLQSDGLEQDLIYWKHQLTGITAGLELPTDRPRTAAQSFRGAEQSISLRGELLEKLRSLSSKEETSLFVVLLTGFVCLLSRYSMADDIVIGTETREQSRAHMEDLMGPVSNPLVLRADCSGNPPFRELVQRVSAIWADAEQHGSLPFGTLLQNLVLPRDTSRSPLFQVMFAQQDAPEILTCAGLTWEHLAIETKTETLDLRVNVLECGDEVQAHFSYNIDLFDPSTVERMMGHFRNLLEVAATDPERALSAIPLLTADERRQLLIDWNNTSIGYPTDLPLHKFIEDQVERTPDATALVCESQQLTYRQLNDRSNQLAHHLRKRGVGPDVLVGVYAERSIEMVLALLGTMKAGGAYVPLDPEYPRERLHAMLQDAQAPVVLTQARLLDRLPPDVHGIFCLDRDWASLNDESTGNLVPVAGGKNLAYAIYTSGSTGKPKGVPNTHEGIVNRLLWMQDTYKLNATDRVLQKTPYSFDVSVWEFFWPLMTGACLVVARPHGHRDPSYLVDLIAEQKITTIHFVPSMLSIFLEADGVERCRTLRRVFASGEALSFELQQRFFEQLQAELHNLYGPTEAAVDVTYWQCRADSQHSIVPIGRPVANTQIYILDPNLEPVPIGVAGELHIGGRQLARGYLNRPDLTAEKFIRDPFSDKPGARLYKTGDLARFLPDGSIEYLGRIDHQVKLRGFRIELGEIEAVISEDAGVRQAVVIVREDVPGDKHLVAYVVPASGHDLSLTALKNRLKLKLPEFMVPSRFVVLQDFPMTTSGKVDRKALPAPKLEHKERSGAVAPRNERESTLVSIFRRILNADSIGITDDFFDLGGHSLAAVRLLSEIQHATGKHIPLALLFRGATPEYLAQVIEEGIEVLPEPTAMVVQAGDSGPAFFAVVPPGENAVGYMKLARYMGADQQFYKLQGPGPLLVGRPYSWAEMESLADEYVEAMRGVQPEGPYYFGGMCDGAHLAIRMARKLEQLGESVGMLAIFDTWVLENSQRRWAWNIYYYSQRLREFPKLRLREQFSLFSRPVARLAKKVLGRPEPRGLWPQAYWPEEGYVPPTFRGRVTLFKKPKQPYFYVRDPQMGWGSRAQGGVDVQVLPIHHGEMLHEPSVQILARRLTLCLQQAHPAMSLLSREHSTNSEQVAVGARLQSEGQQ